MDFDLSSEQAELRAAVRSFAREQLNDLMLYMDGKDGAQELLDKLLKDPDLMKAVTAAKTGPDESSETSAS